MSEMVHVFPCHCAGPGEPTHDGFTRSRPGRYGIRDTIETWCDLDPAKPRLFDTEPDNPPQPETLPDDIRDAGRRGVAKARAVLAEARRR